MTTSDTVEQTQPKVLKRGVLIPPMGRKPTMVDFNGYEDMTRLLGGTIDLIQVEAQAFQTVMTFTDAAAMPTFQLDCWVNDEFLFSASAPNPLASSLTGRFICGPMLVTSTDPDGETVGIPEEAASWLMRHPEQGLFEDWARAYTSGLEGAARSLEALSCDVDNGLIPSNQIIADKIRQAQRQIQSVEEKITQGGFC